MIRSPKGGACAAVLALVTCLCSTSVLGQTSSQTVVAPVAEHIVGRAIGNFTVTPDGLRAIYALYPEAGSGEAAEIVLRNLSTGATHRFPAGNLTLGPASIGRIKVAPTGRWFGFLTDPVEASSGCESIVVSLVDATSRRLSGVCDIEFLADDAVVLTRGTNQLSGERQIEIWRPERETSNSAAQALVGQYAMDASRRHLAWSDGQAIWVFDTTSRRSRVLARGQFTNLTWSPRGNAIAALQRSQGGVALATFTNVDATSPAARVYTAQSLQGLQAGYEISDRVRGYDDASTLVWREDESGVFFGVSPPAQVETTDAPPFLAIWHWRDRNSPRARDRVRGTAPERPVYLAYVVLETSAFTQLADATVPAVLPRTSGRFLLGYYNGANERFEYYDRRNYPQWMETRDYYTLDLQTGERTVIALGLRVAQRYEVNNVPRQAPNGERVVYQERGNYFSFDPVTGARRNLTSGLPTQFYHRQNLRNTELARSGGWGWTPPFQGWSADGRYLLLSDQFDVWALDLQGGRSFRLTPRGSRDQTSYARTGFRGLSASTEDRRSLSDSLVDLTEPIYFHVSRANGETGLAVREGGGRRFRTLLSGDAQYNFGKSGDTFYFTRRSADGSTSYQRFDPTFSRTTTITATEVPEPISSGIYLTFRIDSEVFGATLYPPIGYVAGRSYPTIVRIYEMDASPHGYYRRGENSFLDHGYALLVPDIATTINENGRATVQFVNAAITAATATGIVDPARVGLTGHSHGGYEALFIATQESPVSAVVAYAGVANNLSRAGSINPSTGYPYDVGQQYLAGEWWDSLDAYVENSPLFHAQTMNEPLLIVHGDADTATPLSDVLAMFIALHRLHKPVVLLEYEGEEHEAAGEAAIDVDRRIIEFFDHFLRDRPAPRWWADGASVPADESAATAATRGQRH